MKRIRWEVRFSRKDGYWSIWRERALFDTFRFKAYAVKRAAEHCRTYYYGGELSELTIKRRDGTIQDKRTYGADPRRTRG